MRDPREEVNMRKEGIKMKNILKKILAIMLMVAVGTAFALIDPFESFATSAPAKPKLKVETTYNSASLNWTVCKGATKYEIYQGNTKVKTIEGKYNTKCTVGNLTPKAGYTYKVRAVKTYTDRQWKNKKTGKWTSKKPAKKYRGKSRLVKKTIAGSFSTAQKVSAKKTPRVKELSAERCNLTWSEVPGATYEIYRDGELLSTASTCSYKDTTYESLTSYTYNVRAKVKGVEGVLSEDCIAKSPPLAPKNFEAYEQDGVVHLSWSAAGAGATYKVYMNDALIGQTQELQFSPANPNIAGTYAVSCTGEGIESDKAGGIKPSHRHNYIETFEIKQEEIWEYKKASFCWNRNCPLRNTPQAFQYRDFIEEDGSINHYYMFTSGEDRDEHMDKYAFSHGCGQAYFPGSTLVPRTANIKHVFDSCSCGDRKPDKYTVEVTN